MKALYLASETWQNRLYLHGSEAQPPVKSVHRQPLPDRLADGLMEEVITIECRGAGILNFITDLEKRLTLTRDGIDPQFLWLESSTRPSPVYARILDGRIEMLGGGMADRTHGYQGLRLRLVRPDWLQESIESVGLTNPNGGDIDSGLTLYNHADGGAGHVNYCDVKAEDIGGTQPTPGRMVLEVGDASARRLGRIIAAGGIDLWNSTGSFDHVLEGETASPGSGCSGNLIVPDASASGGSFQTFQWVGSAEAAVCSWSLTGERLAWLAGRGLRPVMRLHNPPPAGTRWRWKILQPGGTAVLDQSPQVLLDASSRLQVLPTLFPPVQSPAGPYQAFTLEAWLEGSGEAARQIDLDFVHLLPLENYCRFEPVGGIIQGQELVVDWHNREVYAVNTLSGEKSVTHIASGAPVVLRPGSNHRIYLLYESDAGFLIDDTSKLRLYFGARWIEP